MLIDADTIWQQDHEERGLVLALANEDELGMYRIELQARLEELWHTLTDDKVLIALHAIRSGASLDDPEALRAVTLFRYEQRLLMLRDEVAANL